MKAIYRNIKQDFGYFMVWGALFLCLLYGIVCYTTILHSIEHQRYDEKTGIVVEVRTLHRQFGHKDVIQYSLIFEDGTGIRLLPGTCEIEILNQLCGKVCKVAFVNKMLPYHVFLSASGDVAVDVSDTVKEYCTSLRSTFGICSIFPGLMILSIINPFCLIKKRKTNRKRKKRRYDARKRQKLKKQKKIEEKRKKTEEVEKSKTQKNQ